MRALLLSIAHLGILAAAYWLAFALRFDFSLGPGWVSVLQGTLPWVLLAKLAVFYAAGHYQGSWRYVTFADLLGLVRAAALSLAALLVIDHLLFEGRIPRTVLLLDGAVTILLMGATRAGGRLFLVQVWPALCGKAGRPALLVGNDPSSRLLAYQINCRPELELRICGLLSVTSRAGQRIGRIPVLGRLRDLRTVAAAHGVRDILVIAGTLSGRRMRRLMDACKEAGLTLKIIPPVEDLFGGGRRIPVRELEIDDLLRRTPVRLDDRAIGELIEGRRVLVAGAGGSIGSEICRQLLKFRPAEIVLLGRGENRIFAVERELRGTGTAVRLCPVIGNITDPQRMRQVFEQYRPEVVFHAAAHKHVPLMEGNVGEAIRNNVLGTRRLADLADEYDVRAFVLISSDKAVNPRSVMGATKYLGERYVQALGQESATRFVIVRLGNVLGSSGSVVPIFQEQIRRGGPITVTDPRMTRFFMTIPEAAQLVLQATAMGRGGDIFLLDMGEPVRIVDLARDLVRLSGLPPSAVDIVYTGVRPGEKLDEELHFQDEQTRPTAHPKVRAAEHRGASRQEVGGVLAGLEAALDEPDDSLRARLVRAVPEYRPAEAAVEEAPGEEGGEVCCGPAEERSATP